MTVDRELMKGCCPTLVLRALSLRSMYGYEIVKEIEQVSAEAFSLKEGTIYPVLHRLEQDGHLESFWEDGDGNRKRRYYRITEAGRACLARKSGEWNRFRDAMDKVLSWTFLPQGDRP